MSKDKGKHKRWRVDRKKAKPRKMDISVEEAMEIADREFKESYRKLAER